MKIPIAEVKQAWRDALAEIPTFAAVAIHAAWPGDQLLFQNNMPSAGNWKAAIWFGPSVASYDRHSIRADRQRRLVTVIFHVFIEVQVTGESNEGGAAALMAEQIAYDLWQPIDEHVADEKHLASPELVQSATVDGDQSVAGFTDTGYGYRMSMPIAAKFSLL